MRPLGAFIQITLAIIAVFSAAAHSSSIEGFNSVYTSYLVAIETGSRPERLQYAEKALEIAQALPDVNQLQLAILTHNVGNAYYANGRLREARRSLDQAIKLYRKHDENGSLQLAQAIMDQARVYLVLGQGSSKRDSRRGARLVEEAVEIVRGSHGSQSPNYALFLIGAARLLQTGQGNEQHIESYLNSYIELHQHVHGEDSLHAAIGRFELAKHFANRASRDSRLLHDANEAKKLFSGLTNFIDHYEPEDNSHDFSQWAGEVYDKAYRFYFTLEDMDNALVHCLQRSRFWPKETSTDPNFTFDPQNRALLPTSRIEPRYPISAASQGLGGVVELRFTVDEKGLTGDIEVVSAEPKDFAAASIEAVEQWTFVPLCDESGFIKTKGLTTRLTFLLAN